MKLVICEKPSVAKAVASALGVTSRADSCFEGNGLIVSWCVGHLVSPMDAAGYDPGYKKWKYDDLPILPEPFRYVLAKGKEDAFQNLKHLMEREDVTELVNACDAGREGELIFRLVYEAAGCTKPFSRLWISSMEDAAIREGFQNLRPAQLEPFQGLLLCYMDQGANPYYIDAMESVGLPADSCRLSNNAAGVALLDEFPKIGACCISNNAPCDSSTMNSQFIERHLDVDTLPAAIPMRWEDPHTRKYARESLRRIIDFVERHTGETYDWDACRAIMEKHNDEVRNEQEKWGFMATPYTAAALAVPALFHTFYYAFSGGRNPEVMKAEHKVMRILEQAYADKTNCFPKTRYRAITWGGPPCYWLQFPNWLYNCWGILMIAGMDLFSGNVIIDTTDEETILDGIARNYETGVMRRHLTGGWRHLVEFWDEAEKFHCDMVILHDDITCKGALGLTGVILDQAKEKKTKLMVVSNDMFDHRTISRADIRQQVNDFMFSVMQAEPLDASLLQYDDYEGW